MWARALPTVWLLVAGVVISMEIAGRAVWNYSGDQNAEDGASALVESMHALQPALAEHTEQGPQPPRRQFTHVPTTPTLNDTADAVSSTIPRRPESCERSPAVYFPMATDCAGQSRDGSSQQVTGHGGETAWDGSADTWTQCDRPAVQFVTTAKLVNGPHVRATVPATLHCRALRPPKRYCHPRAPACTRLHHARTRRCCPRFDLSRDILVRRAAARTWSMAHSTARSTSIRQTDPTLAYGGRSQTSPQ